MSLVALLATSSGGGRAGARDIAFASKRDGNWEIYSVDSGGRRESRLTNRESQDRFALWSPDRSQIAFASQVDGDHWELWVMNADGSRSRRLATPVVAKGFREWSHDGTRIVFAGEVQGNAEIFTVEVASGRVTRLTNSTGDDANPTWSPDDRFIAFSSERDGNLEVYVVHANGSSPGRITRNPARDGCPAWSPDGSTIAFASDRDGGHDVYLAHVADGRTERLTTGAQVTSDAILWAPGGAYLAIQSNRGNYDVDVIRMRDHKRWTVAGSPKYDGQFDWSPSGNQIAFVSERDGFNAVYIADLAGQERRVTSTASLNPAWSR